MVVVWCGGDVNGDNDDAIQPRLRLLFLHLRPTRLPVTYPPPQVNIGPKKPLVREVAQAYIQQHTAEVDGALQQQVRWRAGSILGGGRLAGQKLFGVGSFWGGDYAGLKAGWVREVYGVWTSLGGELVGWKAYGV